MTEVNKGAQLALLEANLKFHEGTNNANPFSIWQGLHNASWCDSFAQYGACQGGGYNWPDRCQFGVKGDAYCPYTEAHAKELGIWVGKGMPGFLRPEVGWQVLFDWDGNGAADHIGTVVRVNTDGTIITIEGNYQDSVQYVRRDWKYIRGFVALPFTTQTGGPMGPDYSPPVNIIGKVVSTYFPQGHAGGYILTDAGYVYGFGEYPGHHGNPATDPGANWGAGNRVGTKIEASPTGTYRCWDTAGEHYDY